MSSKIIRESINLLVCGRTKCTCLNNMDKFITIKEYDNYKKCFSSEYKKPKMAKTGIGNSVWYNWIP